MTSYIVEHRYKGNYVMETITGVEDIDISIYKDLLGVWVCESPEELQVMEKQIREMRNARSSKQA
jgi:hypothetical protein